eukprot:scaffold61349_cov62-Phaeocystis_antarctica.AAC.4
MSMCAWRSCAGYLSFWVFCSELRRPSPIAFRRAQGVRLEVGPELQLVGLDRDAVVQAAHDRRVESERVGARASSRPNGDGSNGGNVVTLLSSVRTPRDAGLLLESKS